MTTTTGRVTRRGKTEMILLPEEVAFGREVEVTIVRSGDVMSIYPKRPSIAVMIAKLNELPAPDSIQERDIIEPPERPGL
jgi:antitoxin VapB